MKSVREFITVFVFGFTMIMGFFFTYGLIWLKMGLPLEGWAIAVWMILAILSFMCYCKCMATKGETEDDGT